MVPKPNNACLTRHLKREIVDNGTAADYGLDLWWNMCKKGLTLLVSLLSTVQLQALAVAQVINDDDKYKPITFNDSVRSVVVNCIGAHLDLTHFSDRIVINGNGNQIVARPCESLVILGTGNSVDLVDGLHVTKIRQGQDLYQKPTALNFYELDPKSPSGIKIKESEQTKPGVGGGEK